MLRNRSNLSLWLVLLSFYPILANAQSDSIKTFPNWFKYNDSDYYVSFPKYLDVSLVGVVGTRIQMFTKQESELDSFMENISLMSEINNNPDAKLEHYVEASEIQYQTSIKNFVMLENVPIKINGMEGQKLVFMGSQGKYKIQWEQYIFLINGKGYIWTLTSELSAFPDIEPLFDRIIHTFKIK
ncbi:MAG: hypothetical protein IT245_03640 [Bacteroidia bacterium]|nr:hypothetical protein [Bacteroidia bacterium]